jgi:probable phosphoglycerate mutase
MASPSTPNDLWLVRHGETEWVLSRKHTGRTDLPLTARGEAQARALAPRLHGVRFARVLVSPMQRATRTAELAGFGDVMEIDEDLREVDYGEYEGRTTAEIRRARPDWDLWLDGNPGGETIEQAAQRADRVIASARAVDGPVLLIGHGHMLRTLAARALEMDPEHGRNFLLEPSTISIIGAERSTPALRLWNDSGQLPES